MSGQSFCALGRQTREDSWMLSTGPQVGIWLCEATDPTRWGGGGGGQGAVQGLWASWRPEITDSKSQASQTQLDTVEELKTK